MHMMKEILVEVLELEDERRGKGRLGFQTWVRIFGMLQSPSWEGPYKVKQVISGNAYLLQTLQGKDLPKALNGRFLKQYHPSMWQDA
jgi:hypothetical protein